MKTNNWTPSSSFDCSICVCFLLSLRYVITYRGTKAEGGLLPSGGDKGLRVPNLLPEALRPAAGAGSAAFTNIFVDTTMRISRGDRNELRIYVLD